MASRTEVLTCVLSRFLAVFELPYPKGSAEYQAMAEIFQEELKGYDKLVLEDAVNRLIRTKRNRWWPAVGEMVQLCEEVLIDREEKARNGRSLPKPERRYLTAQERARGSALAARIAQWGLSGKSSETNADGSYRYSFKDLEAEVDAEIRARK